MACPPAGVSGGSAALLAFVAEHERALTYDFRHYLHFPLSEVGDSVTFGEAIHLVQGLLAEPRSHIVADLRGYTSVATDAEIAQITLAEWYVNVHRDTEKAREPFRFPRPWPDQDATPIVSAEERAELERKLLERSALRDR